MAIVRRILSECAAWLMPGGRLGIELGAGQSERVLDFARSVGIFESVEIEKDGSKIPRFLLAVKKK